MDDSPEETPFRVERSVLAVPASNPSMIRKALATKADVVFLDLEDAVAVEQKAASRQHVIAAVRDLEWGRKPRMVRVNALDTPFFYRDIVEVVEAIGDRLDLIMVPKINRADDVYVVETLLGQIEAHQGFDKRIGLEVQIESAEGLINCERIAGASSRIEGIVFGPGDYAASVGMPVAAIGATDDWDAIYPGHRFHAVMHHILVAGRAAGLRVIDGPFAAFRDIDGLRTSALRARALGYDGKWCIHPEQIAVVNDVFTPGPKEIAWAHEVVEAHMSAAREGRGALAIDGVMIDAASIRMARTTLARGRAARLAGE